RHFVIPVDITTRKFVRAFELRPGNLRVVHHAVLSIDRTRWSRRRDAQDREPGHDGMLAGQAQAPDGQFVGWTPGHGPQISPPDMPWRLDPGTDLVLQLHFMPGARPETVAPSVALYFTDRPPAHVPVAARIGS